MSLPARGVWIEIVAVRFAVARGASLPARGVWIEICAALRDAHVLNVAPRKGSVD